MSLKSRISRVVVTNQDTGETSEHSRKSVPPAAAPLAVVTAQEQEWALSLHHRLVKVMDLSLITSMDEKEARQQIRDVSQRLMAEESMPLNESSRQRVANSSPPRSASTMTPT